MGLSVAGLLYTSAGILYNSAGLLWSTLGKACACCTDLTGGATLYLKACPCYTFPDEVFYPIEDVGDCALPEGDCIYVDLRSLLEDDLDHTIADRFYDEFFPVYPAPVGAVGPTIIVEGVCYRFAGPLTEVYADPSLTEEERQAAGVALGLTSETIPILTVDLPDGATRAGGNGVELALAVGVEGEYSSCSEEAGCSAWANTGAAFVKAAVCDGSAMAQDLYVCIRAAYAGNMMEGCLCIDFSETFTAGQVAAAEAEAGVTLHTLTPAWAVHWVYGPGHPDRVPSESCCFCVGGECLQGSLWYRWGDGQWFPLDVCCGKGATLRYDVDFSYTRTLTQDFGGGDVAVTTTVGVVTSLEDRTGGGTIVHVELTQTLHRPAAGPDVVTVSEVEIELPPVCCLFMSGGVVPTAGGFSSGTTGTFVDGWDSSTWDWYDLVLETDPSGVINDDAYPLRVAWNASPWGVLQLAQQNGETDAYESLIAAGPSAGDCATANFHLEETFTTPGGSRVDECEVNLTVTVVQDDSAPCGYFGPCGSGGWGAVDLGEMVP